MSLSGLRGKILASVLLGLAVVVALSLLADVRQVGAGFERFAWGAVPAILGCTVLNYALRWAKWDYYLRRLGLGGGVSRGDSALIFSAGLIMSITPGKVGEVFKSFLLRRVNGTPATVSAPIVLAERVTDGLAMLLLMALGLSLYPPVRPLFWALLGATLLGVIVAQNRPLCERILGWVARLPLGAKLAPRLLALYASTAQLLHWRILLVSTLLSFVSWGFECVAMYFVLTGMGIAGTPLLLLQATFIFAASTLLGLVSFLPGGLGASEASSAGLLVLLVGMDAGAASAATLIIRFCTLWFGVLLGMAALAWFGRRYKDRSLSGEHEVRPYNLR
ncbi:MAG: flippase-like domain-containing protein [Chloroflexales bacterium]|nr:flippase-like domain-containing protein [Chloroflexales bacterium]